MLKIDSYFIMNFGNENLNIYNIIYLFDLVWKELTEKQLLESH
ncbi:MAG: hypothetical protein K0S93_1486 [Nitrososphaeraceae archaeon]|jgi:hypothetical protein|nr:hypothetical protein [Nitrososphaeraceae archaeon]